MAGCPGIPGRIKSVRVAGCYRNHWPDRPGIRTIAEFERERIIERTKEGLAAARKRGRIGGRPPALSADAIIAAKRMRDADGARIGEIAKTFNVSASTVRRALR